MHCTKVCFKMALILDFPINLPIFIQFIYKLFGILKVLRSIIFYVKTFLKRRRRRKLRRKMLTPSFPKFSPSN